MFSEEQKRKLDAPLDPSRVERLKTPDGRPVLKNGKPVGYIEAWDDIEQANQIFGFDGWSRETVLIEAVHTPQPRYSDKDPNQIKDVVASYWAKVRITVFAGPRTIVREGCGAATAYQKTVGEAVENAIKAAESDATKRAFVTFGNQFGLALYDKTYKNVRREEPQISDDSTRAPIDVGFTDVAPESGRESGRAPGTPEAGRAPESAPASNTARALSRLEARPTSNGYTGNGHRPPTNGGLRY